MQDQKQNITTVTEKECLDNIIKFCLKELKKIGWLKFYEHSLSYERVRLLKDYEKDANLPLPAALLFENAQVDFAGIKIDNVLYQWSDICCIIIKYDVVPANVGDGARVRTDTYIVFSLHDSTVLQIKVGNSRRFFNLLGHFISQYRLGIGKQ